MTHQVAFAPLVDNKYNSSCPSAAAMKALYLQRRPAESDSLDMHPKFLLFELLNDGGLYFRGRRGKMQSPVSELSLEILIDLILYRDTWQGQVTPSPGAGSGRNGERVCSCKVSLVAEFWPLTAEHERRYRVPSCTTLLNDSRICSHTVSRKYASRWACRQERWCIESCWPGGKYELG